MKAKSRRTKTKTKTLGNGPKNIFHRFQAARDNAYIDCAISNKVGADIKECERISDSLIDEFFTGLQAGKIKSTDIFSFGKRALRQRCSNKEPVDLLVCQKSVVSAVARIKTALDEKLG